MTSLAHSRMHIRDYAYDQFYPSLILSDMQLHILFRKNAHNCSNQAFTFISTS